PEAFRVNGLIEGFSIALQNMRVGDRWVVYIPQELGYGRRASGPIPGCATLIFEIELLSIC
ncbi:MAG: FKBP-type peptidyl-prolyl cis-trans isomerase, partial [Bacteroidaceae bacterium]|nr:FKBP-type peptidyl-prolyl cis-trans isomerase [Bacteroidaceae bacterium]